VSGLRPLRVSVAYLGQRLDQISDGPRWPYILVGPAFLLVLIVSVWPLVLAIGISLTDYVLTRPNDERLFVGLDNYAAVLANPVFQRVLGNTVRYVAIVVSGQFLFGLALALLMNRATRLDAFARGTLLLPWAVPGVLVALMWAWIFDWRSGFLNGVLQSVGVIDAPVAWLADPATAPAAVMVAAIWSGYPFFAVLLLAGLQAIPRDLHEAASVDGASAPQRFWSITLPLLMPSIFISTVLMVIWTFQSADLIYVLTGGGPGYATAVVGSHAFSIMFRQLDFGVGSAIGLMMVLVSLVFAAAYVRVSGVLRQ